MGLSLDPAQVTADLPDLDRVLGEPRLRPIGMIGGSTLVFVGTLFTLVFGDAFWGAVLGGVLVFVGVPLFSVGLAAPEPTDESALFSLGVDLNRTQRSIVGVGALLVLAAPVIVAILGPVLGFGDWLWLLGGASALLGAVLIFTGFLAWTSATIADPSPPQ